MATHTAAAANYRRELGGGLIQRWSTSEDTENIAQLCGLVFRDKEDEPLNIRAMDSVRRQMSGDFPLMGPGDYALIEDTGKEAILLLLAPAFGDRNGNTRALPLA